MAIIAAMTITHVDTKYTSESLHSKGNNYHTTPLVQNLSTSADF